MAMRKVTTLRAHPAIAELYMRGKTNGDDYRPSKDTILHLEYAARWAYREMLGPASRYDPDVGPGLLEV